ncbi:MAG: hypothetical protein CVU61_11640 [Deltaproteobacteria bacterium HGW-Deltaproteobacteria-19]|jgi:hypothetical protein|nr:MAG: hypothetical protein CVU61_11640 [Deltaproteobacteria bacterium HGW-Deltaproteobacteria-19]
MKRFDLILLKIFLYGLPVVIVLAVFGYCYSQGIVDRANGIVSLMNSVTGLLFAAWMAITLYLSFRLTISESLRDQVIAKITFMRERDEREAILTGKATKTTFLITLAILILLFSLSCIQVSIYRVPQDQAVDGKTGMISLGLGFNLFEQEKQDQASKEMQRENIFLYKGLPVSSEAILLMLIVLQIISYNYSMRRLMK